MTRVFTIICAVIITVSLSCRKLDNGVENCHPIYLSASLGENMGNLSGVKSPYKVTVPDLQNPLKAKVLVSTAEDEYEHRGLTGKENGVIKYHTDATFSSLESQLLYGPLYNSNNIMPVYFTALYPQQGWNISGTSGRKDFKAEYTFNGKQDLMFAPKVSGSYEQAEAPVLTFKHLLTYIRLSIYAESDVVASAWGKIKSIKIKNHPDMGPGSSSVSVDLSSPLANNSPNATFIKSDCIMGFYNNSTDASFPPDGGYQLEYTGPKEVAYVLMAPVVAQDMDTQPPYGLMNEFAISIESEHRTTTVNVNLMDSSSNTFLGSTMGKEFSITLKFVMGDNVSVQARVTDWETGGIGIGDVNE